MSQPKPKPIIGWPGGKGRLLKHLLPLIPPHHTYVEVFFGGGAVFFAKEPSPVEVINDINGDLVALMRNARSHPEALCAELELVLNSRQEFEDFKVQPGLTEIQRCARWFVRNKLSFSGQGRDFTITRQAPFSSREARLDAIRAISTRLDKTTIENRSWEKVLKAHDHDAAFFFLDPPYLDAGGDAYAGWSEQTLRDFAAAVLALRGRWLVTFQDCSQIREVFAGQRIKAIERANGIGNTQGRAGRKYREVIITPRR